MKVAILLPGKGITIYDIGNATSDVILPESRGLIGRLEFSGDGSRLIAHFIGTKYAGGKVWDVRSGDEVFRHPGPIVAIAISPNGREVGIVESTTVLRIPLGKNNVTVKPF